MMHFRFLLLLLWLTIGHAWTPPLSEPLGRRAILGRLTAGAVTWFALDDPLRAVAQAPLADLPAQVVEPAAEGMSQTFQDKTIGEIEASGIIFKDILKVDRVGDPKVSGVQLYVSEFRRPITKRLLNECTKRKVRIGIQCAHDLRESARCSRGISSSRLAMRAALVA